MPEEKFKLPRSSYEEICKIVKAYGRLSKPSSLDDVAQYCAINKTGISANNAFLSNVEIIEGGRSKEPTEKGRALAQALEHEIPDEITARWARIVSDNDFLNRMSAAVRIRGKMEVSALEAHIAYSAGETKSSQVMTGARAVVDILRAAGLVHEQDGQLSAVQSKSPSVVPEERTSPHLITNETQLTHDLHKTLFFRCFPFPAGAGPACGNTVGGPQSRPSRSRDGVGNRQTTTWRPSCPWGG
jgi:hypothetical protein